MTTKLKLASLAAVLAAAILGTVGVAAAHGHRDRDDDGPRKAERLARYDANKDGKLDDAERAAMKADFEAKHAADKAARLAKYDANKDGKLDDAERAAMKLDLRATLFKTVDTNGDGVVSLAEFQAAKLEELGGGFQGRHGGHHGHRGGQGGER
jgi:hypothetical protein